MLFQIPCLCCHANIRNKTAGYEENPLQLLWAIFPECPLLILSNEHRMICLIGLVVQSKLNAVFSQHEASYKVGIL